MAIRFTYCTLFSHKNPGRCSFWHSQISVSHHPLSGNAAPWAVGNAATGWVPRVLRTLRLALCLTVLQQCLSIGWRKSSFVLERGKRRPGEDRWIGVEIEEIQYLYVDSCWKKRWVRIPLGFSCVTGAGAVAVTMIITLTTMVMMIWLPTDPHPSVVYTSRSSGCQMATLLHYIQDSVNPSKCPYTE